MVTLYLSTTCLVGYCLVESHQVLARIVAGELPEDLFAVTLYDMTAILGNTRIVRPKAIHFQKCSTSTEDRRFMA
jgi:hypothetical protein